MRLKIILLMGLFSSVLVVGEGRAQDLSAGCGRLPTISNSALRAALDAEVGPLATDATRPLRLPATVAEAHDAVFGAFPGADWITANQYVLVKTCRLVGANLGLSNQAKFAATAALSRELFRNQDWVETSRVVFAGGSAASVTWRAQLQDCVRFRNKIICRMTFINTTSQMLNTLAISNDDAVLIDRGGRVANLDAFDLGADVGNAVRAEQDVPPAGAVEALLRFAPGPAFGQIARLELMPFSDLETSPEFIIRNE